MTQPKLQKLTLCSSSPTSNSLSVLLAMHRRATSSKEARLVMRFVRAACTGVM